MGISLDRVILFVRDVDALAAFYREAFGMAVAEEIPGEWVALRAGACELGLHRIGEAWRDAPPQGERISNVKIVLTVDRDLVALRDALVARGVEMGAIKRFPSIPGPLCHGRDPDGNVFQLVQSALASQG